MAGGRYTVEQLEHLRESPLVKKPDTLPSIEQWMDASNDHNTNNAGSTTNRRSRTNREGDAGATGEHRTERPILGAMGQFGRRASTRKSGSGDTQTVVAAINRLFTDHGDEPVIGGPPKLNFASATRSKPGQSKEATGITSIDGEHTGDRFPRNDRWRDGDRTREKELTNGRRGRREEGEGWQNTKSRKSLGQEDFDRGFGRNGDRERKDADENGEGPRRRNDRWGRRDDANKEAEGGKFGTTGQGGWRDRNREREKERDWTRGGGKAEEDPEWMDAPAPKKETKAHTQEDFQRWKEQMKAKDAPTEEKEESKPPELPSFFSDALSQQPLKSAGTPSGLEPNLGSMFGTWSTSIKAAESAALEPAIVKAKPAKASRFMNMFAKVEEPTAAIPPPAPAPASPAPLVTDKNADQEGFQRILQMLGGTGIGSAPAPQPSAPTPSNGLRQGGGISLDFHQSPPPPEMQERRQPPQQMPTRSSMETQALLENILAPRPSVDNRPSQQSRFNSMSPDNALFEQFRVPRPDSNRPGDEHPYQQPPSRNNNNPQDPNLAALLNSRSQVSRDKGNSAERDFLLNLMQQPRNTPPQLGNQNLPRQPMENQNMQFFDHNRQQQGQPKGRGGPPPGFMSERMDPRMDAMYMENELMRQEQERRNQVRELQQQEASRHKGGRGMPMGYSENERDVIAGLQRRNTAGEIPRQMTNMGIPSQHVPDLPYMSGRQPGMPPTPQEGPNVRPPPGFNGPMRQPPGLGGPGPQHQMGPGPSFSAGNTPMGPPPGFNPANNMRGGMFPGGPGGPAGPGVPGNGMQGPPQGYFPPPQGYGPPLGLRGEDPRMMFEQQFGGPGPRQQQQQGRPPNMY
ncbi:uncharacterized protein N0V89_007902 [Didymosphaeria variabile]|uniref:Uncharacterized protein n=1 Tax=Didymosphaeria variabile TaxID=1932322 RepID=A0A9W9CAR1_9PLEO|nr:uncharacterized protein N0V89_007902 [Didymosphaeria variabile]KAJ4352553.1 hypothetical protein N0V89_007902 [Didymosphaeria variabile]